MRNAHLDRFHTEDPQPQSFQISSTQKPDQDEIQPLFFDLVRADRITEVKHLLHHFRAMSQVLQTELIRFAAASASGMMMDILYHAWGFSKAIAPSSAWFIPLTCAVQSKNSEVVQWILKHLDIKREGSERYPYFHDHIGKVFTNIDWATVLQLVLESDSEEIFQLLLQDFVREFTTQRGRERTSPPGRAMELEVVRATARRVDREQRLLFLWEKIQSVLNRPDTSFVNKPSQCLRYVAETCYSIPLAKALLHYGAELNYLAKGTYLAPLQCALRRSSPEAAEMARFLLYRGANPNVTARKSSVKLIKEEKGAREISKWLGMDWDELVAKVKADREAGICPREYM